MVCRPRRLALKVNLAESQPDREKSKNAVRRLLRRSTPKANRATAEGRRAARITVDQAERLKTDKGEWLL
ncbi:hypothetical protein KCP78_18240 [Salmonella enterica subsp. enterica]|nr:hypothetical protein KCP78_18240 [Salmonella enterica subsp. enterica]